MHQGRRDALLTALIGLAADPSGRWRSGKTEIEAASDVLLARIAPRPPRARTCSAGLPRSNTPVDVRVLSVRALHHLDEWPRPLAQGHALVAQQVRALFG